jgi:sigma-B regulation protein RsbU (phosphoserine phosphatase)
VLLTGTSELYPDVSADELASFGRNQVHYDLIRELGVRSVLLVPMRVPNRTIGMLTLATDASARRLGHDDLELGEQLARRAAVAVENSRLHTKLAHVAETLQQSLLPRELPKIRDWELASLYLPADSEHRIDVGGDFYEFFEHEGVWFVIVGDVTGKGIMAASMTALMRHGARVAVRTEPHPAAILYRLDEALKQQAEPSLCTALCLAIYDDHVIISSAGHPPALLVTGDGGEVRQAPSPGPLLGAFADAEWSEQRVEVSPGQLLMLYTDGVTETAGDEDRFGTERLLRLVATHAADGPAALLARLESTLSAFRSGPERDDVAALALCKRS